MSGDAVDVRGAEEDGRPDEAPADPEPHTQTDAIIRLARQEFEMLHDEQARPFARRTARGVDGRALRIPSSGLRGQLQVLAHAATGRYPRKDVLTNVMDTLAAVAVHEGRRAAVHTRVAWTGDAIYLDLADGTGRVVEVVSGAWRVIAHPPVVFAYVRTAEPIPEPVRGGSIDELWEFINVDEEDRVVLVGVLLMGLVARFPHPVLALQGEQGAGKSTTTRVLKSILDPGAAPIRSLPRSERDLAIAGEANWVLAFDNISGCPPWLSDALCRLTTGGGFSTRALYTDDEERVFDQLRLVIVNGIDAIVTRQDLLDRAVVVTLRRLRDGMPEDKFWAAFDEARARILGALLDAAAAALARLPAVDVECATRMADFERWGTAAEPALGWPAGTFQRAYAGNRAEALRASLDSCPIAVALTRYIDATRWHAGAASELYTALSLRVSDGTRRSRRWPSSAAAMSRELRRLTQALAQTGLVVEFTSYGRDTNKRRRIEIENLNVPEGGDDGDDGDGSSTPMPAR